MLQRCPFITKHTLVHGTTRDSNFKARHGPKEQWVTRRRGTEFVAGGELWVFTAQQLVLGENGNLSAPAEL